MITYIETELSAIKSDYQKSHKTNHDNMSHPIHQMNERVEGCEPYLHTSFCKVKGFTLYQLVMTCSTWIMHNGYAVFPLCVSHFTGNNLQDISVLSKPLSLDNTVY